MQNRNVFITKTPGPHIFITFITLISATWYICGATRYKVWAYWKYVISEFALENITILHRDTFTWRWTHGRFVCHQNPPPSEAWVRRVGKHSSLKERLLYAFSMKKNFFRYALRFVRKLCNISSYYSVRFHQKSLIFWKLEVIKIY